jgi:secreted trypsin-like serine protease
MKRCQGWQVANLQVAASLSWLFCGAIAGPAILGGKAMAQGPGESEIELTPHIQNRLTLEAYGANPVVEQSTQAITRTLHGTEKSQCRDYGRRSSSIGSAGTSAELLSKDRVTATLAVAATAIGGHFRTCVLGCDPVGRNCLGIHGNDTHSSAAAEASLKVRIQFSKAAIQETYNLKVGSNRPPGLQIKITDPEGRELIANGDTVPLKVRPNDVFYAEFLLSNRAANEGGCCREEMAATAQVDLRVEKPPILASRGRLEPYIVGGKETTGYKNVVALTLRGQLHCSGTVIGERTILTAAHCVHGYETAIASGEMSFLLGSVITSPEFGPKSIGGGTFPRGNDPIQYDPTNYMHDIAVVYSKEPIPVSAAALHEKVPEWADVLNKRTLLFVGFGYNKSDKNEFVGLGIKREAPWLTSEADDWRFYFKTPGKNTCSGDSGGPAFYQDEDTRQLLLVGVTSVGNDTCTRGADTRVDSHRSWILSKIKG